MDHRDHDDRMELPVPDDGEADALQTRREFLISLGKWSQAAVAAALLGGAALNAPQAQAWGWINRRGGYGGGWVNGGGGSWVNGRGGGGSWVNGSGGGWVNRRGGYGGGSWINRR